MVGNFMNAKEAAAFLEYTVRHIAWLCVKGEFTGAKKDGLMWFIPEDTIKLYKVLHPRNNKRNNVAADSPSGQSEPELKTA